jgi:hypothetical protein
LYHPDAERKAREESERKAREDIRAALAEMVDEIVGSPPTK